MRQRILVILLLTAALCHASAATPRHVVMLGDSNTWLGGDDCSQPRGWNTWFRQYFPAATCRSYARSGATWSQTPQTRINPTAYSERIDDDNVVYNQVCRLIAAHDAGTQAAPDLIIIAAGTNDAWFRNLRPQAFAAVGDSCSIAAAVERCCSRLRLHFPNALLVLLTPMQSTAVADSLIETTGDVLERCAHEQGAALVRLDRESPVRRRQEAVKRTYTYDGTHTSQAGAKANGRLVADRVAAMLRSQQDEQPRQSNINN